MDIKTLKNITEELSNLKLETQTTTKELKDIAKVSKPTIYALLNEGKGRIELYVKVKNYLLNKKQFLKKQEKELN